MRPAAEITKIANNSAISHTLNVAETDQPGAKSQWLTGVRLSTGVSERAKAATAETRSKFTVILETGFKVRHRASKVALESQEHASRKGGTDCLS